jgi:hypothetical protein
MKKIELNLLNSKAMIDFVSKFQVIDKNILLEIDGEKIIAKAFKDDINFIKYGELDFADLFTYTKKNDNIDSIIKLWIYNIDKFKKSLMVTGDCKFLIEYDEDEMFATKIELKTKTIKKIINVVNNIEFSEITDEQIKKLFNKDNANINMELTKEFLVRLRSLAELESNNSFSISVKDKKIKFIGTEFELEYDGDLEINNDETTLFNLDKIIFKYIDIEDYDISLKENAVLFFGENSFKLAAALLEIQEENGI